MLASEPTLRPNPRSRVRTDFLVISVRTRDHNVIHVKAAYLWFRRVRTRDHSVLHVNEVYLGFGRVRTRDHNLYGS